MVNGKPTSHIRSLSELEDLGQILGTGSFGVVKKVKHKVTGEIYAMKVRSCDGNRSLWLLRPHLAACEVAGRIGIR